MPISLNIYNGAATVTNKYFRHFEMPEFERIHLPDSVKPFSDVAPIGTSEFLIDDNRSAVSSKPYVTIDDTDFYFSVKGIGSTTSPFSRQLLKREEICSLLKNGPTKERILNAQEKESKLSRFLTSELWSRGCPYGSQGLEFATIAMKAAEMSDPSTTSIHGFRIAPLVKIVKLPLSDHAPGHATVLGAIALGARVVEKHFTDDTRRVGPDHGFSMDPAAWREMVERSRELEAALGSPDKTVAGNESDTVVLQRRCLRAATDLPVGTLIERRMVDVLRPAPVGSIPPYEIERVIGRRTRRALAAGDVLDWSSLGPPA